MVYSTVYNYTKNASVCYHSADDVAGGEASKLESPRGQPEGGQVGDRARESGRDRGARG